MTLDKLMEILNDPNSQVACFLSDKPNEVSREEFKRWLGKVAKGKKAKKKEGSDT